MAREDENEGKIFCTLPQGMHPDLAREIETAAKEHTPWTLIRPLQKGVDDPQGATCSGAQGNHHLTCNGTLEAVQYSSAFGDALFYCEKHALEQNDWDIVHYRSKFKEKKMLPGWQEEIDKMMAGFEKKRKKKEEPEEIDPS